MFYHHQKMSTNVPKCPEMSRNVLKCPTHVQGLTCYHVSCENLLRHQQQNGSCFSTALAVAQHGDTCKVHMKKCVVQCRVNVVQCRPDVVLMSWWNIGIMYHGKMQQEKVELTPATPLVIATDMNPRSRKSSPRVAKSRKTPRLRYDIMYDVKLDKNCRSRVMKLSSNVVPVPS